MSTIATIKLFNEEDFIYYVMKSLIGCVDKFILVEGCTKGTAKNIIPPSLDGGSTDNTWIEVERFINEEPKIPVQIVKMGFVEDEIPIWNKMINYAKVGDIVWMVDADEYYEPLVAHKIIDYVKDTNFLSYKIPMVMYWHDFYHVIVGGMWDSVCHERIIRIPEEGCCYTYKSDLKRPDGSFVGGLGISDYTLRTTLAWPIHHFSYVRSSKKVVEKKVWQLVEYERWGQSNAKHGFGPHMAEKWERPADFITSTFEWFTNIFDDRLHEKNPKKFEPIRIVPWNRKLEGSIINHPMWNYKWDERDIYYKYPNS